MLYGARLLVFACLLVIAGQLAAVSGTLPGKISYQGKLTDSAGHTLPDGTYQMVFKLFDAPQQGNELWTSGPLNVTTSGGVFLTQLNVGPGPLESGSVWVEVTVGNGQPLPRIQLLSAPYALIAGQCAGSWNLSGNANTVPGTHFVGTSDATPLEIRVNIARAIRIEPGQVTPSIVGGHEVNYVNAGVEGAFIGGGGAPENTGWEFPVPNSIYDSYGFIGSGRHNQVGSPDEDVNSACDAVVCGGTFNSAAAELAFVGGGTGNSSSARTATIAGGLYNSANGIVSFVGGGEHNQANGNWSVVAGGAQNQASGEYAFIGGGLENMAVSGGPVEQGATVGGGVRNWSRSMCTTVAGGLENESSGWFSAIGGGQANRADAGWSTVAGGSSNLASGVWSMIPGGELNAAEGDYSLAAGRKARAVGAGSFVWGDSTDDEVASTGPDQFVARASGGVWFYTSPDLSTGAYLATGDSAWSTISDRAAKKNIVPVDPEDVLERLSKVPISTWSYRAQGATVRHIGPMAQDFYAAFGVGADDKHISTVDPDGVALAAIQALDRKLKEKDAQIEGLQKQLDELRAELAALRAKQCGWPEPARAVCDGRVSSAAPGSGDGPVRAWPGVRPCRRVVRVVVAMERQTRVFGDSMLLS
ncbi:MAG: tail fiber domain-containing protein [Armatimonadota bacterium]